MRDVDRILRRGDLRGARGRPLDIRDRRLFLAAQTVSDVNLETQRPDGQAVSGLQFTLAGDALVIDERAVLAAEVAHADVSVFHQQHAVMPANQITAGPQMTILGTTDEKLLAVD